LGRFPDPNIERIVGYKVVKISIDLLKLNRSFDLSNRQLCTTQQKTSPTREGKAKADF